MCFIFNSLFYYFAIKTLLFLAPVWQSKHMTKKLSVAIQGRRAIYNEKAAGRKGGRPQ